MPDGDWGVSTRNPCKWPRERGGGAFASQTGEAVTLRVQSALSLSVSSFIGDAGVLEVSIVTVELTRQGIARFAGSVGHMTGTSEGISRSARYVRYAAPAVVTAEHAGPQMGSGELS